jgi:hypothetical protein
MKKLSLFLLSVAMLFVISCKDEETSTQPTVTKDPIVGVWVSEGTNIAPGLASVAKAKKVVSTFNEDKSYSVVQTDSANTVTTYTGTYSTTESAYSDTASASFTKGAKIISITAIQSSPSALTAKGIYAISGNKMSYEVINEALVAFNYGLPTAKDGFGSTTYSSVKLGATWLQKYVK